MENTLADELADMRRRLEDMHRWWERIQPMEDWDDFTFREKLFKLENGKTLSEKSSEYPVERRSEFSSR